MKKLFLIAVLIALAINGFAQRDDFYHFEFSSICESGQTLYYHITDEEEHTVTLTFPFSDENIWFQGDYYEHFIKPQGDVIIPSVVTNNGVNYSVTGIDSNTFWECIITSVFIPNTVNYIAPGAFGSCEFLETLFMDDENPTFYSENNTIIRRDDNAMVAGCKTSTIPDGVEIICREALYAMDYCGVLIIPNSVRIIEEGAFAYNHFSGSLILPESLETIGAMAFYVSGFSGSLTIPNSVTEIGHHAFYSCHFNGSLTLSSSLFTISNCAFANCHFSGTLVIPNSVNLIVGAAFFGNNFSELVFGESVATIESIAFANCNNLTGTLRLPASLTQIDRQAFAYTSFNEIYSPNGTPPTLGSGAFLGNDTNIPIHIPYGCTNTYQNAEGWNYFSNFIETEMNLEGEWYYEILNDDGTITYQHLLYSNDTVINDKEKVKVIVRTNHIYDKDEQMETTREYVYEENDKVYWWNKDLQEFTTLYDLSAEEGDEWEITVGMESITVHVDSVVVHEHEGRIYKKLSISDTGHVFDGDIVVGLGHLTSFFPEKLMRHSSDFEVNGLRCYWVEEALVYQNGNEDCDAVYNMIHSETKEVGTDALGVYPNPSDGFIVVGMLGQYRIANLMGQTLLQGVVNTENQQIDISSLSSGLYFLSVSGQTVKLMKR